MKAILIRVDHEEILLLPVKLWLNIKSENNANEHVGGIIMMH